MGFIAFSVIVIVVVAAVAVRRHYREIGPAVDDAIVGGLAAGVRETRAIRDRVAAFRQRVIAKADEPGSRKPD